MKKIDDWAERNSPLLPTEAWGGAGLVLFEDGSQGFHQKIEHFWELFNHAGRRILQLQEIHVPRQNF
jgi:hypothetical protein